MHKGDPAEPYAAAFWCAMAACAASVLLVPFLTIGTQGHRVKENVDDVEVQESIEGKLTPAEEKDVHIS